jgi:putative Mg2+ transporter-C (MgtC) family protein
MNWKFEMMLALRALVATGLGAAVGWQRERAGQEAGLRTYATVSLGACVFGLISLLPGVQENTRISAQVVTGVGFICTGVVLRHGGHVRGLTTAASIWATAATGLIVAYSQYVLATLVTVLLVAVLAAKRPGETRRMVR